MGQESIGAAGWAPVEETCRENNVVTRFLTNPETRSFSGQNEMSKALYEHSADGFEKGRWLDHGQAIRDLQADGSRLSAQDGECWEGLITAVEVIEVLGDGFKQNFLDHDDLPNEFYSCMPDMFEHLLVSFYSLWKHNGKISNAVTQRMVVTLIKTDPDNEDDINLDTGQEVNKKLGACHEGLSGKHKPYTTITTLNTTS